MPKYLKVAKITDFPPNGMKLVKVDGLEILLIRVEDEIYAFNNRCPHMGFSLFLGSLNGKILRCGFHYAEFDVTNGKPLNRVTEKSLRKIAVRMVNSEIFVEVPNSSEAYYL
ncbi:MAG: Rieske (2Fe-2S) protein [Candidatus Bathyarchaeales archaeon]